MALKAGLVKRHNPLFVCWRGLIIKIPQMHEFFRKRKREDKQQAGKDRNQGEIILFLSTKGNPMDTIDLPEDHALTPDDQPCKRAAYNSIELSKPDPEHAFCDRRSKKEFPKREGGKLLRIIG
jgi:hypothetical protein